MDPRHADPTEPTYDSDADVHEPTGPRSGGPGQAGWDSSRGAELGHGSPTLPPEFFHGKDIDPEVEAARKAPKAEPATVLGFENPDSDSEAVGTHGDRGLPRSAGGAPEVPVPKSSDRS